MLCLRCMDYTFYSMFTSSLDNIILGGVLVVDARSRPAREAVASTWRSPSITKRPTFSHCPFAPAKKSSVQPVPHQ